MDADGAIRLIAETFGGRIESVTPRRGFARDLVAALEANAAGSDDPLLAELLEVADEAGAIDAYRAGRESGHGWAVCSACGEATLRPRGKLGLTDSGAISKSATKSIECRMTPGCKGRHLAPGG